MRNILVPPHPLLCLGVIEAKVQAGPSPEGLCRLLSSSSLGTDSIPQPLGFDRESAGPLYTAVRTMLRHGGYKPAGRGKPASEYLARVFETESALNPILNLVDVNNVISLHSGFPASILDGDLLLDPVEVCIAKTSSSYVFNTSGQEIQLDGLLCVHHQDGTPCANPVKDSMLTKVHENSRHIVAFIYGPREDPFPERIELSLQWYSALLSTFCAASEIETTVITNDSL